MAIEYNNIILNIDRKPSSKSIMVAIPMNMYRIETNEFSHGLNFFQKTVLKLKAKPGIKDEIIGNYTGLDPKLIGIVLSQLRAKGLINEHGALSDKGKDKLWEVNGLVVDSGKKRIGYVLQYLDQAKLYQYYVHKLVRADILEEGKKHPKVITGTKGDGADRTDLPFFLDGLYASKSVLPGPDEREILRLITNSNKRAIEKSEPEDESSDRLSGQLAIRLLNEQPDLIWLCTYIYLQEREDKTFEPDWRVLDPFGHGDNVALKFYLDTLHNRLLLENIETKFAGVKTVEGKILSDYQEQLNKAVEDKILADFSFGINHLDLNLQQYIQTIVKNYILQKNQNYCDLDASVAFSLNIQNALENILKQDREKRLLVYEKVFQYFGNDSLKKRNELTGIYRQRVLSTDARVPESLLRVSKGALSRGNSLLSYLVSFILTYNFDCRSPLFKVLRDRTDIVIEVARLRNEKGHGQTSKEKSLSSLSKVEVEKYYGFIKTLTNDYIQYQ